MKVKTQEITAVDLNIFDARNHRLTHIRAHGFEVYECLGKFLLTRYDKSVGLYHYLGYAINAAEKIFIPEIKKKIGKD